MSYPQDPYQGNGQSWPGNYPAPNQFGYAAAVPQKTSPLAVYSLIMGVLSLFTSVLFIGFLVGISAVIMGIRAQRQINDGTHRYTGRGLAIAGLITGGLGVVLGLLWVGMYIWLNRT